MNELSPLMVVWDAFAQALAMLIAATATWLAAKIKDRQQNIAEDLRENTRVTSEVLKHLKSLEKFEKSKGHDG